MTVQRLVLIGAAIIALSACATAPPVADIAPGERPDIESVEAGLWMQMDEIEKQLQTSGRIVTDPALNEYLRQVTCRLSADYCADLRIYVVQTPHFNASMAPNGSMQIWTGLLVRAQNEAQLAYVIGHEMGHYIRRHSLQRWRDIRVKTDIAAYFGLATGLAGVGYVGSLGELAAIASAMAFSRDQERESDDFGFELIVAAGYDPTQAADVWEVLIAEQEASGDDNPTIFLASHPSTGERIETLRRKADANGAGGEVGRDTFHEVVRPFRAQWLEDELRKHDFGGTEVVLANIVEAGEDVGEARYFQGELYRLRGDDGDNEKAIEAYRDAISLGAAPAEAHRSLGLTLWKTGQNDAARRSFENYLLANPGAPDRVMIEHYVAQLQ